MIQEERKIKDKTTKNEMARNTHNEKHRNHVQKAMQNSSKKQKNRITTYADTHTHTLKTTNKTHKIVQAHHYKQDYKHANSSKQCTTR